MNIKTNVANFGFYTLICKKTHLLNYLTVENISKSYGELSLFQDISFSIHKDQKIAFVAKNGTGKTSILNMLSGKDTPDSGNIIYRKEIQVAFLSQDPELNNNLSIPFSIPRIPFSMLLKSMKRL